MGVNENRQSGLDEAIQVGSAAAKVVEVGDEDLGSQSNGILWIDCSVSPNFHHQAIVYFRYFFILS